MKIKRCHTKDCQFNKTGVCIENQLPNCPNIILEEVEENASNETDKTPADKDDAVLLYPGREMGLSEITSITHMYNPKWIVIIGDSGSGKTTLLATIFDLFQMGPFANLYFSGSRSLIGFEIRCHDSRAESGQQEPKTPKTNAREEFKFLHLEVKKAEMLSSSSIHLLVSDISGEKFRAARGSSIEMKNLTILRQADYLLYLIDGEKLLDDVGVNVVMTQLRNFLRKAIDDGMLPPDSKIKIAVSKWDKLHERNFDIKNLIEEPIKAEFGTSLQNLKVITIASRPYPLTENIDLGFGLADLLLEWTNDGPETNVKVGDNSRSYKRNINNFLINE